MRAKNDASYENSLAELAGRCEQLKLEQQATISREWFTRRDPRRNYLFLPPTSDEFVVGDQGALIEQQWSRRFRQLREGQAAFLFELSSKMLNSGRADLAFQLLHEVLHENPDHAEARRILGYRRLNGQWRRPTGDITATIARSRHSDFPWPPGGYWQINSQHFRIITNGDKEAAIKLAGNLERLFDVWKQLYFDYWSNRDSLQRLFDNDSVPRTSRKKHVVVLFASRDEYNAALRDDFPGIEQSLGFYSSIRKESMLFDDRGEAVTIPTWRHEVTHQLFQESFRTPSQVGLNHNFWLIEGLAMYMESMVDHQRYVTVGGFDAQRLQFARFRLFHERFFVPLDVLSRWGRDEFQRNELVKKLYTESSGVTHFLMDGDHGRHRQALVALARLVYTNRQRIDSLETLTDASFQDLGKAYQQFLRVTKQEVIQFLDDERKITQLSLSYSDIDDEALARLANLKQLEWLALSNTQVTDSGLQHLTGMQVLDQLFLEQTEVTDAGLIPISELVSLRELSLAGTKVSDTGLEQLKPLTKLTVLNLEGCNVSPASIERLKESLPDLQ